jgi:hypothetical protein
MAVQRSTLLALLTFGIGLPAQAQPILFDFDTVPLSSPLPVDVTVSGITAHLSATGQGFSIQNANVLGFTPVGFSGRCIYPSSVFPADLLVGFSQPMNAFSILYAVDELATDSSATMRVTAYMGVNFVGTNTAVAQPGTWPTQTLGVTTVAPFDRVVVHYDSPPPTGGDYGPILMADNMLITPAPIPEPTSLALVALAVGGWWTRRRQRARRLN